MDELKKYAGILAGYSCDVKPGENVMVLAEGGEAKPLVIELVKEIYRRGANPSRSSWMRTSRGNCCSGATRGRWAFSGITA